jgi:hypothetical protein
VFALRLSVHVPVPLHPPPDQPANVDPTSAAAVSVTLVPLTNDAEHVDPQSMPVGEEVTPPVPVPPLVTVNVGFGAGTPKDAVTPVLEFSVSVHVPVPLHPPPDQPVKIDPTSAAAVSVTLVPAGNDAEHVEPQLTPIGEEVTPPVPVPLFETVNVGSGAGANAASTLVFELSVNVHVPVPVHPPPDQPVNVEFAAGVAVSVMLVPLVNDAEQVVPQSMPAGEEVTLPPPVPLLETLSCAGVPPVLIPFA